MTGMHRHHEHGLHDRRLLVVALALIVAFMAAEVVVGLLAGSLALLADAGHMLTDAAALALAVFASWAASLPARGRFTFGFARAEILAAQANGVTLAVIAVVVLVEAALRLADPTDVDAPLVATVAALGIVVNGIVLAVLARARRESLNVRGAYLHLATDFAAFLATLVAAVLIAATGWNRFDAGASVAIAALMLAAAWSLVRESGRIFLEGAPTSAPPSEVGRTIASHPGVVDAHDLHVWTVTSGFPALSAHVLVEPGADCHRIRLELESMLHERFGLEHTTLQVEHVGVGRGLAIRRLS
jgi:cobalt-zinc-cadmium efflux system protein